MRDADQANAFHNGRRKTPPVKVGADNLKTLVCKCGVPFTQTTDKQVYHQDGCAHAAKNEREKERRKVRKEQRARAAAYMQAKLGGPGVRDNGSGGN